MILSCWISNHGYWLFLQVVNIIMEHPALMTWPLLYAIILLFYAQQVAEGQRYLFRILFDLLSNIRQIDLE